MASVSMVFRKDKLNKKGNAPIHFRIIKNRKISYISSGIIVHYDMWDESRSKVKTKHKNSGRLNSFLSNKFTELQDKVLEFETQSRSLTSKQLRNKVFGDGVKFFPFAEKVVETYKLENKIGTYDKNKSIIAKLKAYPKANNSITFQEITTEFLSQYELYLRQKHGNHTNTIHKDLKFIRKVFNDAIRQDLIDPHVTPFRKYQLKTEKTHRTYLSDEELKAIENVETEPGTKLELHKHMFLFGAYVGLRISDILQLRGKNFDGTHLHFTIQKTKTQISIKAPDVALKIISKYHHDRTKKQDFIFPMLLPGLDFLDPIVVDTAISRATAHINKNLKILAKRADIDKRCSFHVARHSFAVRALQKGISIDKISKLMGHAAIRETQLYAKIVNSDLDKAMDAFND